MASSKKPLSTYEPIQKVMLWNVMKRFVVVKNFDGVDYCCHSVSSQHTVS